MSATDIARANWRADLSDFSAAVLRDAGMEAMADEQATKAVTFREEAALIARLTEAKDAYRASDKTDADKVAYNAAKRSVMEQRRAMRELGAPRPGIVDNFSEPTGAELIDLGY